MIVAVAGIFINTFTTPSSQFSLVQDGTRDSGDVTGYKPRKLGQVNVQVRNAETARDWNKDLLGPRSSGFTPGRAVLLASDSGKLPEIVLEGVGDNPPGPRRRLVA